LIFGAGQVWLGLLSDGNDGKLASNKQFFLIFQQFFQISVAGLRPVFKSRCVI
jgi:hypothetical protein